MSNYFQARLEQRMKEAHDRANYPVNRINLAFNESEQRLLREIKKLYKGMDSVAPHDRIRWLNERISVEEYAQALEVLKTTKDKAIRQQMIDMIKANANAGRIRRKTALIQAIKREQLWMTDKQLTYTKSHLESTYRNVMSELGYTDVSKKTLDETLQQRWLGSNYSERIWKNQKVLAKKLETELLQGFISGKSYRDMAREMSYLTDVGRFAANRLVRTETSYVVNSADLVDSKRRGIKAKKFEAHLDSKTSKLCRNNNQKILRIEDIKIGENAPPLHPFCRSFLSDLLEGWDYQTEEELERMIDNNNRESNQYSETNSGSHGLEKLNFSNSNGIINIEIDKFVPCLEDTKTGKIVETQVHRIVNAKELDGFTEKKGWYINWKKEIDLGHEVYALTLKGDSEIQGLISLSNKPENSAVEGHWLVASPKNRGENKKYKGVGGHLYAIAGQKSVDFGHNGFFYGKAKNQKLLQHYIDSFGATPIAGYNFYISEKAMANLLDKYNFEEK